MPPANGSNKPFEALRTASEVTSAWRGRQPRLISRCRVDFRCGHHDIVAETDDVSLRGLFVRTEALLPVGQGTELRVVLNQGTELTLHARVAHILTPNAGLALGRHAGIGFELAGAETADRAIWRAHVESLRAEIREPEISTVTEVFLIEPSPPQRARMARCLEVAGFKVIAVEDPTEVLQASATWRPDVIIAAAEMAHMNGVELAYAMAEHVMLSDVPLVLTGEAGDHARLDAYRAGVRDFIPKPFLDDELVIRLHRVAAPPASRHAGLRGSLVDIGLGTLLSLFEFERKSGVLLLLGAGEIARVFIAEGRCLKVESSATTGSDGPRARLMRLLDWRDGQFEFSPVAVGGLDEVGVTTTVLLLEHARQTDESRVSPST